MKLLDSKGELTDLIRGCRELCRDSSPPLDDHCYIELEQLHNLPDAVSALEDTLTQRQYLRAIQLLHAMRKHWKGEALGMLSDDDIDCLFFMYARYMTEDREGMDICMHVIEYQVLCTVCMYIYIQWNLSIMDTLGRP